MRGFEPSPTYSAHWMRHPGLAAAIEDHLAREPPRSPPRSRARRDGAVPHGRRGRRPGYLNFAASVIVAVVGVKSQVATRVSGHAAHHPGLERAVAGGDGHRVDRRVLRERDRAVAGAERLGVTHRGAANRDVPVTANREVDLGRRRRRIGGEALRAARLRLGDAEPAGAVLAVDESPLPLQVTVQSRTVGS